MTSGLTWDNIIKTSQEIQELERSYYAPYEYRGTDSMQIIVMTSDNYYHCIPPFLRQWHKYFEAWNDVVEVETVICGFSRLPASYRQFGKYKFHSIGKYEDYPANKWSDAFIKVLDEVAQETFILMLEDYWLYRPVDVKGVKMLYDYATQFNTLKIDLARDRLYADPGRHLYGAKVYDNCGYLDLVKSPKGSAYQLSLWGGIWRRDVMRLFIRPGEKAQEIEMVGTERVNNYGDDLLVLGTFQAPMPHCNIYQSGTGNVPQYHDRHAGAWKIKDVDLTYMREFGIWNE